MLLTLRTRALVSSLTAALLLSGGATAANRAVVIGPSYPGGPAFDDTIASDRADQIADSLEQWGNWAGNVNRLTGAVTCQNIYDAIAAAAAQHQPGDIFLLIYHGHGSYVANGETVPPAADTCDETIYPSTNCLDDAVKAALAGIPAGVRKMVVLASCYSGGFWNGQDAGDLERLTEICLLSGADECSCLPEPSTFVDNLLAKVAPAGWPNQNSVTFQQFIDAVMNGAAGSAVNQNRWNTLPKCPCEEPDPVYELCDFDFAAAFDTTGDIDLRSVLLEQTVWTGGCCLDGGYACQILPSDICGQLGGQMLPPGELCRGDQNGNGQDDACESPVQPCAGDTNCDGVVDFGDINPFVAGLANPSDQCSSANFDINGDGAVNFGDINPFVSLLSSLPLPWTCE